ncbi:hypothetical protein JD969_02495 [Planctomycetota bacterium]|nr:hypothetical protein JD969_02495 [Planctomycetota bacterium]
MLKQILVGLGWGAMFGIVVTLGLIELWAPVVAVHEDLSDVLPYQQNDEYIIDDEEVDAEEDPDEFWLTSGMKIVVDTKIDSRTLLRA